MLEEKFGKGSRHPWCTCAGAVSVLLLGLLDVYQTLTMGDPIVEGHFEIIMEGGFKLASRAERCFDPVLNRSEVSRAISSDSAHMGTLIWSQIGTYS